MLGRSRRARSSRSECGAIGVLCSLAADDPEGQARVAAFLQGLAAIGLGHRPQRPHRLPLGAGDADAFANMRRNLSRSRQRSSWPLAARPWGRCFRRPAFADRVRERRRSGWRRLCRSLARPGGNATGFVQFEYGLSGKWLELLKEIAPRVTRVAVLRDPALPPGRSVGAVQSVAPSLGSSYTRSICATPAKSSAPSRHLRAPRWRTDRDGGAAAAFHRHVIVTLAARHKLPAVYSNRVSLSTAA